MLRVGVTTRRMMKTGGMGLWAELAALLHVYTSLSELFWDAGRAQYVRRDEGRGACRSHAIWKLENGGVASGHERQEILLDQFPSGVRSHDVEQVCTDASAEPLRHEEALIIATSWSPRHFIPGKSARDGAGATPHDLGILGTGPRAPRSGVAACPGACCKSFQRVAMHVIMQSSA